MISERETIGYFCYHAYDKNVRRTFFSLRETASELYVRRKNHMPFVPKFLPFVFEIVLFVCTELSCGIRLLCSDRYYFTMSATIKARKNIEKYGLMQQSENGLQM